MTDPKIELWPIDKPIPYENNPRINDGAVEAVANSIREFGFQSPIIVDSEGVIIAGHTRLKAAQSLGLDTVPVIVAADLTDEQAKALRLADNKTGELAEWDFDLLGFELSGIADINMGDFGFDLDLSGMGDDEDGTDSSDDVPPPIPDEPKSKPGEIYRLGDHVLICADSTLSETYERLFGVPITEAHASLCVTSPPYGVGKDYEEAGIEPWFETMRPVIANLCKIANVIIWQLDDLTNTGGQFIEPTTVYSVNLFEENGYKPLWFRLWEKAGINTFCKHYLVSNKPAFQYEQILAFANPATYTGYKKRLTDEERREWGYYRAWQIRQVQSNAVHPAMFPIELPIRCIKMHSDEGDVVLEPFSGSGTTMMACERLGRKCKAIERDPKYVDVAIARWENETGRKAERIA